MKSSRLLVAFIAIVLVFSSSCTANIATSTATDTVTTDPIIPGTTVIDTSDPTTTVTSDPTTAPVTADPTTTVPPETNIPEPHVTTVLIDPGHGFVDTGCVPEVLAPMTESQVNLRFALKVKELLEAYGYRVLLTHDGVTMPTCAEIAAKCDKYGIEYNPYHPIYWVENQNLDAYERTIWSNVLEYEYDCDLFVSFHADSYPDPSISGSSIYYCVDNEYTPESRRAVTLIDAAIRSAFPDRRLHTEGFSWDDAYVVTKYTKMPSLLIEIGFASSPDDVARMKDDEWTEQFVSAVVSGIISYLN